MSGCVRVPGAVVLIQCVSSRGVHEFGSEFADIYDISGKPLAALIQDCDGVPLITSLDEAVENLEPVIRTTGSVINTKFVYQ